MRLYNTPWLIRKFYNSKAVWQMPAKDKTLYLTFDDGPTSEMTTWILDLLDQYHAKATFFCVGANVEKHPDLFSEIQAKGHAIGNHTFNHLNGWKTDTALYCDNILEADSLINSRLFRPPYGRMKKSQMALVNNMDYKTFMWSVLTYDFDKTLEPSKAWVQIVKYTKPGSILVFHDNTKAFENLKELLPKTLAYYSGLGYKFEKISA